MDIVTYTGYTFEELLDMAEKDQGVRDLLEVSDLLVDGPYIAEERDLNLAFRVQEISGFFLLPHP